MIVLVVWVDAHPLIRVSLVAQHPERTNCRLVSPTEDHWRLGKPVSTF